MEGVELIQFPISTKALKAKSKRQNITLRREKSNYQDLFNFFLSQKIQVCNVNTDT